MIYIDVVCVNVERELNEKQIVLVQTVVAICMATKYCVERKLFMIIEKFRNIEIVAATATVASYYAGIRCMRYIYGKMIINGWWKWYEERNKRRKTNERMNDREEKRTNYIYVVIRPP